MTLDTSLLSLLPFSFINPREITLLSPSPISNTHAHTLFLPLPISLSVCYTTNSPFFFSRLPPDPPPHPSLKKRRKGSKYNNTAEATHFFVSAGSYLWVLTCLSFSLSPSLALSLLPFFLLSIHSLYVFA